MIQNKAQKRPDLNECRDHLKKSIAMYGAPYCRVRTNKAMDIVRCLDYLEILEIEAAIRKQMLVNLAEAFKAAYIRDQGADESMFSTEEWLNNVKRQAMNDLGLLKGEDVNAVPEMQGEGQETGGTI